MWVKWHNAQWTRVLTVWSGRRLGELKQGFPGSRVSSQPQCHSIPQTAVVTRSVLTSTNIMIMGDFIWMSLIKFQFMTCSVWQEFTIFQTSISTTSVKFSQSDINTMCESVKIHMINDQLDRIYRLKDIWWNVDGLLDERKPVLGGLVVTCWVFILFGLYVIDTDITWRLKQYTTASACRDRSQSVLDNIAWFIKILSMWYLWLLVKETHRVRVHVDNMINVFVHTLECSSW